MSVGSVAESRTVYRGRGIYLREPSTGYPGDEPQVEVPVGREGGCRGYDGQSSPCDR